MARPLFSDYVGNTVNPELWFRMQAISGSVETNQGSGGTGYNASINGGITLSQPGQLGEKEAHDIDGATGYYRVTTGAALQSNQFWWGFLVNPDTVGELNAGRFFTNGSGSTNIQYLRFNPSLSVIQAVVGVASGQNAVVTTSAGLTAGEYAWVFMLYDDTAAFTGDRKIHLYKGQQGTVAEFPYSSNVAAAGTFAPPATDLFIANLNTVAAVTFDGKMDEVMRKSSLPATLNDLLLMWSAIVSLSEFDEGVDDFLTTERNAVFASARLNPTYPIDRRNIPLPMDTRNAVYEVLET